MDILKNIWKNFFKILMNVNNILLKYRHFLIKFSIYLICTFQLIQIIIEYTNYNMNNEYRATNYIEDISFTFCIDQDNILHMDSKIFNGDEYIDMEKAFFISKRNYRGKYCYSFYEL